MLSVTDIYGVIKFMILILNVAAVFTFLLVCIVVGFRPFTEGVFSRISVSAFDTISLVLIRFTGGFPFAVNVI